MHLALIDFAAISSLKILALLPKTQGSKLSKTNDFLRFEYKKKKGMQMLHVYTAQKMTKTIFDKNHFVHVFLYVQAALCILIFQFILRLNDLFFAL